MIELSPDGKSSTFIITRTDGEGFHHQIQVPKDELYELYSLLHKQLFK